MLRGLKQFRPKEEIFIFGGFFKGPSLGPLEKHKCQGPVQFFFFFFFGGRGGGGGNSLAPPPHFEHWA